MDKGLKSCAAVVKLVDTPDLGTGDSIVITKKPQNSNLYPTLKIVTEVL
jgi:hypothetical protein